MTQAEKEKVAIVLIHKYKCVVDGFKKDGLKSILGSIQKTELSLHEFTTDKPIARKFFNQVLEYRRTQDANIQLFGIPLVVETEREQKKEPTTERQMELTKQASIQTVEVAQEEPPFEF